MTFSTEKNKIYKIWNDSVSNQFQISNQIDNDKIVLSKITELNRTNMIYNNVITLGSGWIIPSFRLSRTGRLSEIYKEYSVEINGIDKKLIPYISSKICYRVGGDGMSIPIPDSTNPFIPEGTPFDEDVLLLINDVVEIRDIRIENNVNIIYKTSVHLGGSSLPEELQFNFYINLVNPNYYQST